MKKNRMVIAFFASIIGAIVGLISTFQHFRIMKSGFAEKSYCAVSDFINCDIVNASSYSEFLGVPIAWWGFIFYVLVMSLSLYVLLSSKERIQTVFIITGLGSLSVIYSIFLGYIAVVILDAFCVECFAMYVCNIAILLSGIFAMGMGFKDLVKYKWDYFMGLFGKGEMAHRTHFWNHAGVIALFFALGWLLFLQIRPVEAKEKVVLSTKERIEAFNKQSVHEINIDEKWAVWGNPDSKVKIVEFSEFQCPFCRFSAFEVRPFLQEFKKDIAFYFVNFPLDSSCNRSVSTQMHPLACEAARAGVCAQLQDKFWSFHDELFRNARSLTMGSIRDVARGQGLKMEDFESCMNDSSTEEQILKDVAQAEKIHIEGTPSIFINGKKLADWRDRKFLKAIIEDEIDKSRHNSQ